jgi:hypothetical protein
MTHNLVLTGPNRRVCTSEPDMQIRAVRFRRPQFKLGHGEIQIRPRGVKTGQYRPTGLAEIGHSPEQNRPLNTTPPCPGKPQ